MLRKCSALARAPLARPGPRESRKERHSGARFTGPVGAAVRHRAIVRCRSVDILRASRQTGLARLCLAHHRTVPAGLSPAGLGPAPGQHPDVDSPPSLHLRAAQPAVADPVHAEGPRVWLVLLHQRPVSREVPPAGLGRCPVRASGRPRRRAPRRELGSPCWTSILPAVSYPARGSASVGRGYIWGGPIQGATGRASPVAPWTFTIP